MIAIIDYGAGNLLSIKNMLRSIDVQAVITSKADEILEADKLILPGVGAFDHGISNLRSLGLVDILNRKVVAEKTPILGICLGVQLFTQRSDEGKLPGLGWIDAETIHFDRSRLGPTHRIPNMGWCDVSPTRASRLFAEMPVEPRFYFVHSYHLQCHAQAGVIIEATHGYQFAAGIEEGNIVGVQFHPEKSHKFGRSLLANFVASY